MSNELAGASVGAYMRKLWLLYAAISAGVIVIITILFILMEDSSEKEPHYPFTVFGIAISIFNTIVSFVLLKNKLFPAPQLPNLLEKLNLYRSAYIIQLAFFEGAILANMVLYYISGNSANFYIGLIMLVFLLSKFPSRQKISNYLKLSDIEFSKLMRDENMID